MKCLGLIALLCAAVAFSGCGNDDSIGNDVSAADTAKGGEPTVEIPKGPPPDELVVRDIRKGEGAVVKDGDKLSVAYAAAFYKDGKEVESTWAGTAPKELEMDSGVLIDGFEQGIEGMRVGGRRELIVPSELANNGGDLVYVVDLLAIK